MVRQAFHHTFFAMNTRFSMVLPGVSESLGRKLSKEIETQVDADEQLMSRFGGGVLAQINLAAYEGPVAVPEALWDILIQCRQHWKKTLGLFDISCQGLTSTTKRSRQGMDEIRFDESARLVRFMHSDNALDLGAVGKGIALKGVESLLRKSHLDQAFVSFGESSILALGDHPVGGAWRVGFAEVGRPDHFFDLKDQALSVSGHSERRKHIIDPRTGAWFAGQSQVGVVSDCPFEAEVLSTALCMASTEVRATILTQYKATFLELPATDDCPIGAKPRERDLA